MIESGQRTSSLRLEISLLCRISPHRLKIAETSSAVVPSTNPDTSTTFPELPAPLMFNSSPPRAPRDVEGAEKDKASRKAFWAKDLDAWVASGGSVGFEAGRFKRAERELCWA